MLGDPVAFWQLLGSFEGEPIRLEDWQVAELRDHSRFRAREKAPQIGFSWCKALEHLWGALLFQDYAAGFVSVSEREAREKILYARKLYEGLPSFVQRWVPLATESTEELGFGDAARPSRLMSFAATSSLRGRTMHVVLDEVDFYRDQGREALRIAMGRAARGLRVDAGSTCWGQDTQLSELMMDPGPFSIARWPQVASDREDCRASVEFARQVLTAEDFAEEYDCVRGAGGETFPHDLVIDQTRHERVELEDLHPQVAGAAGYDVGQTRHPPVLTVLVHAGSGPLRQMVIHEARDPEGQILSLPDQLELLRGVLRRHRRLVMGIDANGIGAHSAQALEAEFGTHRVVAITPGSKPSGRPPQTKPEIARGVKLALEQEGLELCEDPEQAKQIRRTRIDGPQVEQPGSRKKSHYDRFWALGYATYAAGLAGELESVYERRGLRVVG